MKSLAYKFLSDEGGATAVEYGLIASLILVALIGGLASVGNAINSTLGTTAQHIENSH
ncbi:Flp family type IVb pilin [Hoeflea olei]|uniref:Flp family type IVb pilin n=1 Tax=Hoeflea olei TaxID=1480615 RepID=UPI0009F72B46|nr:Flp family type IVb pilin [Hoeflea olei]